MGLAFKYINKFTYYSINDCIHVKLKLPIKSILLMYGNEMGLFAVNEPYIDIRRIKSTKE